PASAHRATGQFRAGTGFKNGDGIPGGKMRRFSQRSSLVTLSEINITPLLDLAFVLLIIFVITTPLLDKGLPLNLPKGGRTDSKIETKDIRTVEIDPKRCYSVSK